MPKNKSKAEAPVAYRYSPGDGHTYTWDGGEYATVYRHRAGVQGGAFGLVPTGDHVYMAGCDRTATAFAARVAAWKITLMDLDRAYSDGGS